MGHDIDIDRLSGERKRFLPGQAPKVTPDEVASAIVREEYTVLPDGRTTVCTLWLDNGFTVRGESSCVCAENFDPEIGNGVARRNAESQVWLLLGFRLAEQLHRMA